MLGKYISWAKAKLSLEKDEITGDYVYGSLMRQFHDLKDNTHSTLKILSRP